MKTPKVGIASYEDMKARTLAIARGNLRPNPDDPKVWFTSPESFAKLLSSRNSALLKQLADTPPFTAARDQPHGTTSVPNQRATCTQKEVRPYEAGIARARQ